MTSRRHDAAPPALLTVVLAVLAVALSGCGVFGDSQETAQQSPAPSPSLTPSPVASGTAAAAEPAGGLQRYYRQELDWKACRDGAWCASLRVPLDYAEPSGRAIRIAVLKVPALDQSRRIGSLVVNPGGPGASGVDYASGAASVFGAELRRAYDVVGFDPRGVGESTPVQCGSDEQLNALVESDPDPETAVERATVDSLVRGLGTSCLQDSGDLARHVSTVEVARDLDVLRAVLGDSRLGFFGASYGTFIGATYADLFPRRVGRMVLDGAVNPASSTVELGLVQSRGFEVALRAYVGACVQQRECFLGSTVATGVRRVGDLLQQTERTPLAASQGREVTGGEAFYGLIYPLYDTSTWPVLDQVLEKALDGDGSLLLTVADAYLRRDSKERYANNSFEAFNAVTCLDRDDGVPSSQVPRYLARFEEASPTFGRIFAAGISTCSVWPIHSGRRPAPVRAPGSPPVLVVGTTRDPATPLVWARALADQLPRGVLVTRDGDGHTGYGRGSRCVDETVERYLVSGTVPRRDVSCS